MALTAHIYIPSIGRRFQFLIGWLAIAMSADAAIAGWAMNLNRNSNRIQIGQSLYGLLHALFRYQENKRSAACRPRRSLARLLSRV